MSRNLLGQQFERLTVIKEMPKHIEPSGRQKDIWLCRCECGNETVCYGDHLVNGHTKSCGCLQKEKASANGRKTIINAVNANTIHGGRHSRIYYVWRSMKTRCYNQKRSNYKYYGARNIQVCDEWKNSFASFREWALSHGYDETAKKGDCTLDRIDSNGDYCPENCRFVDMFVQNRNKRNIRKGV